MTPYRPAPKANENAPIKYYEQIKKLKKKHKALQTMNFTTLLSRAGSEARLQVKTFEKLVLNTMPTHDYNRAVLTIANGLCRPVELGDSRADTAKRVLALVNKDIVPARVSHFSRAS